MNEDQHLTTTINAGHALIDNIVERLPDMRQRELHAHIAAGTDVALTIVWGPAKHIEVHIGIVPGDSPPQEIYSKVLGPVPNQKPAIDR